MLLNSLSYWDQLELCKLNGMNEVKWIEVKISKIIEFPFSGTRFLLNMWGHKDVIKWLKSFARKSACELLGNQFVNC